MALGPKPFAITAVAPIIIPPHEHSRGACPMPLTRCVLQRSPVPHNPQIGCPPNWLHEIWSVSWPADAGGPPPPKPHSWGAPQFGGMNSVLPPGRPPRAARRDVRCWDIMVFPSVDHCMKLFSATYSPRLTRPPDRTSRPTTVGPLRRWRI